MVVRVVGNRKVLRLVKDIVCAESHCRLLVKNQLGDLCIDDELRFLLCRVTVVPVVVEITDEVHSKRKSPVHFE